jgi:transposase
MDTLYNIEPKEFKVLERHEVGNCITYVLEPTEKPSNCPDCQDTNIVQHGINQRKVRDLNEYNKLVGLVIKGHRYRCKTCGKTWADTYKSIDDSARMTNRMRDYITDQCLKTTFTDIKKELDISLTAIEKVFAKYTEEMESQRQIVAPRILGMDETMLNGIYRGMYVDVENKRIIDITSNRKLRTVKQWLANLPEKERTECATIDMWGSYKDALTSEMPNVFIVIDKFHVIKHLNEALDTIRKKYTSELSEKERRHIKGNRWLLLTNSEDLDESSQIRLSLLLQSFPAFQEPHAIKEKFREIYLFSKNRSEAEQAFEEWKTTINDYPEYLAFADTVENWRTEIFNYFDFRFTNAITESLNKVSKEISAQGRGYKFDVLRAKLLYRNEAAKPAKFAYHEPQRPSTGVMQDVTFTFMTPFFGKKKSVEVGAGTDIDILSEQINDIVEIRQRIGRINRYANKFKYWEDKTNNDDFT